MARFRGYVQGSRGPVTRLGGSRLEVQAQSWQGKVVVRLHTLAGVDYAKITLEPHQGQGTTQEIFNAPVSGMNLELRHRAEKNKPHGLKKELTNYLKQQEIEG
jgi:hypothetical protein